MPLSFAAGPDTMITNEIFEFNRFTDLLVLTCQYTVLRRSGVPTTRTLRRGYVQLPRRYKTDRQRPPSESQDSLLYPCAAIVIVSLVLGALEEWIRYLL
jgi:hypothetical protein